MKPARLIALAGAAVVLVGCQQTTLPTGAARSQVPIPPSTLALMAAKGVSPSDPILIRAYKKESEMEIWKRGRDGRYALLKTFPICRWSGQLGPKVRQGDRQAPEGFYAVTPAQMNPNSAYYLAFDTGYPNAYDRSHGRSGGDLMVHGTCSSAGCYAMTDEAIAEIYAIAREAFAGGQRAFQFQAYPFHMTADNVAKYRADPNIAFWRNLKEGSDRFEVTHEEPRVTVAAGRYAFNVSPEGEALAARKMVEDEQRIASLVGSGTQAVHTLYADGGQHPLLQGAFARDLGAVSRPEALASAGRDVPAGAAPGRQHWAASEPPATTAALGQGAGSSRRHDAARKAAALAPSADPARVEAGAAGKGLPARLAARSTALPSTQADERPFYERWFGGLFRS
jgi:murein L,D-transpeptidase YafK